MTVQDDFGFLNRLDTDRGGIHGAGADGAWLSPPRKIGPSWLVQLHRICLAKPKMLMVGVAAPGHENAVAVSGGWGMVVATPEI